MNIERGDLFVVTRGFLLGRMPSFASMFGGFDSEPSQTETQNWDRSHEGRVFKATEVCGPVIAGEIVFLPDRISHRKLGEVIPLNTGEVEVWPVTPQYLAALNGEVPAESI